jgi:hypothetical protein
MRYMQPKVYQNKKIEILTLYTGYDGMVKKPSHATVPLNRTTIYGRKKLRNKGTVAPDEIGL